MALALTVALAEWLGDPLCVGVKLNEVDGDGVTDADREVVAVCEGDFNELTPADALGDTVADELGVKLGDGDGDSVEAGELEAVPLTLPLSGGEEVVEGVSDGVARADTLGVAEAARVAEGEGVELAAADGVADAAGDGNGDCERDGDGDGERDALAGAVQMIKTPGR